MPRSVAWPDSREELVPKLRNATFLDARGERARTLEAEVDAVERQLRERSRRFARDGDAAAARARRGRRGPLPPGTALLDVIEIRRYRPRKEGEPLRREPALPGHAGPRRSPARSRSTWETPRSSTTR